MGTFFEDLGKKIGETAETVTNKAGEAVEVQKIRNQIRVLERGNESAYIGLGEIIYRHYKDGEVVDSEAIGICEAIQNREESIEKYEQQISKVKGDVKCRNCGKSVAKEMTFCPYCGEKVSDSSSEKTDYAKEAKEHIVDAAEEAGEKTEAAAEKVKEKVSDAADTVKEKVSDAADDVCEKVSAAEEKIKENMED
ncbi:zinc ribbon domain-containing protein [Muricomes intestini]|jgi:endogenous inhibitor of DNA gyrase (YacG/DUF329 family)|uniref:Zinc ribbon protein n=1 Tax=Muricomes intestini TaxID=1796634 RepID=A0A4R3KB56_9FIRM|nr:zinc-ribbon domain-containing protein [Muricomes intestini]TCS80203.1 zinc ribbon protein [Muricomes intestini]HAX52387.1 zinc ribbon domain-containing protein [Lachnospiraceae bacterium]HCR82123.1 zinc ribbon domain-containing protein [Lachnospiraceae bacterium]